MSLDLNVVTTYVKSWLTEQLATPNGYGSRENPFRITHAASIVYVSDINGTPKFTGSPSHACQSGIVQELARINYYTPYALSFISKDKYVKGMRSNVLEDWFAARQWTYWLTFYSPFRNVFDAYSDHQLSYDSWLRHEHQGLIFNLDKMPSNITMAAMTAFRYLNEDGLNDVPERFASFLRSGMEMNLAACLAHFLEYDNNKDFYILKGMRGNINHALFSLHNVTLEAIKNFCRGNFMRVAPGMLTDGCAYYSTEDQYGIYSLFEPKFVESFVSMHVDTPNGFYKKLKEFFGDRKQISGKEFTVLMKNLDLLEFFGEGF